MKPVAKLLAFISPIIFLLSCSHPVAIQPKDEAAVPDSIIQHVETAPVSLREMTEIVKLNGKIVPDETRQAKLYALVSGKVKSVSVELGDHVNKGQPLAILQSTEVAGAANDLSVARSNVEIAKRNLESTEDLYKSNLATEREFASQRLEYEKALSELQKAGQVAAVTGGKQGTYVLSAPISGYIIEKTISNNSEVRQDNSTNLFTVADLSNVWVIANVYEADINNIHLGDEVTVNTLADPDKDYTGKIDKIYDVLDPANRTMKVRISMSNPAKELKPEMFATINVRGRSMGKGLSIPSKAVVLDNSKRYVVVKKDDHNLEVREIEVQKRIGEEMFIDGLKEGERVVTNSQVFLFEALNSK